VAVWRRVDAGETRELTIAAARELLIAIGAEATRLRGLGAVPVLVAHVLVGGSEVSTGQVLLGTTVELAPFDLAETGAAYLALGHVHKAQAWLGGRVA
jgi:DNA repair exonuclease SbcCD nuclease subunit